MQKLLKLPDKFSKYLVAALLIIIPLYPKFPFLKLPGIYVSIRLEDFLLVIVAVFTFVRLIPKLKELLNDHLIRSIFIFLVPKETRRLDGGLPAPQTDRCRFFPKKIARI